MMKSEFFNNLFLNSRILFASVFVSCYSFFGCFPASAVNSKFPWPSLNRERFFDMDH